jgi:aspartate aminotransferase-like enzyme
LSDPPQRVFFEFAMKKTYLLTPGPTPIPERVSAILGQPIIHHRTPAFETLFSEVRENLKRLFETRCEVITLATTGTGAMDAAISNLFSPGEKVITVNGGKFGERWTKLSQTYGLNPIEIKVERGEPLSLEVLEKTIALHPDSVAVLFQASETSTGVQMPTQKIVALAQKHQLLTVCDGITACGVFPVPMDAWGIDVLMTGAQKAMMIPPGLSFIALSDRAWKRTESSKLPRFYLDLQKEKKAQLKNQTAWTPATSLIQGLHESLRMIFEDGLENTFKRHEVLALATREAVKILGLELLSESAPSPAVTAVKVPSSISEGKKIPKLMREKYGVTITGGQDELEGKIFRLSHFGYCGPFDITTGIACLELVLKELGHPVVLGTGVGAALKVFSEHPLH